MVEYPIPQPDAGPSQHRSTDIDKQVKRRDNGGLQYNFTFPKLTPFRCQGKQC